MLNKKHFDPVSLGPRKMHSGVDFYSGEPMCWMKSSLHDKAWLSSMVTRKVFSCESGLSKAALHVQMFSAACSVFLLPCLSV